MYILHKTYEFVSVVQDKMKQTELGEVIGTLHWGEEGGAGETSVCYMANERSQV